MSYQILIADDEAEIRELLRLYLENEQYTILEAADGEEALRLFSVNAIDLCILDVMMPKLDGFHVLKKLRESSNVPVLMLSARRGDADKILGLNLGGRMIIWRSRLIRWRLSRASIRPSAAMIRWAIAMLQRIGSWSTTA